MIAFALSGGGSRGALEAGALLALLEAGVEPDLLVGTSAGAMNAAFLATDPSLGGARLLADLWSTVKRAEIFPPNDVLLYLTMGWRFLRGKDGLLSSERLRRFVASQLPPKVRRFGDLSVPLYVTAADLNHGVLYLWGENPEGDLIDAVMASSALPTLFPPEQVAGLQLVDGGVVANVPIAIAAEKGSTEVYAINVGYAGQALPQPRGVVNIGLRSLNALIYQQLLDDLERSAGRILLHHIVIDAYQGLPIWELGRGAEMVEDGYRVTKEYLELPDWEKAAQPLVPPPTQPPSLPAGARVWPSPPARERISPAP
ncbi:MAG: patatin-like phospholipase family protein [Anaerolineae bacterium]